MVNPILATIIKKAIQESYQKSQRGGGSNELNKETSVITFLFLILSVVIIQFVSAEYITIDLIKKINDTKSAGPTSAGPTSAGPTSAGPTSAGPTSAGPTSAGPTSAGPTSAGPTSAGPTSAGPTEGFSNSESSNNNYKKEIYKVYGSLIFINLVLLIFLYNILKSNKEKSDNSVKMLFTVSFCVMISSIIISYIVKVSKSTEPIYFSQYIGVKGYSVKAIGIGMMTNIIFGFIDNFGLFFGMDSLDTFLNYDGNNKADDELTKDLNNLLDASKAGETNDMLVKNIKELVEPDEGDLSSLRTAGWGNTFSDFLGAFVGNAVGDIATTLSGVENTPIISEIVGIVIGCILGIYIPAAIKQRSIKNKK